MNEDNYNKLVDMIIEDCSDGKMTKESADLLLNISYSIYNEHDCSDMSGFDLISTYAINKYNESTGNISMYESVNSTFNNIFDALESGNLTIYEAEEILTKLDDKVSVFTEASNISKAKEYINTIFTAKKERLKALISWNKKNNADGKFKTVSNDILEDSGFLNKTIIKKALAATSALALLGGTTIELNNQINKIESETKKVDSYISTSVARADVESCKKIVHDTSKGIDDTRQNILEQLDDAVKKYKELHPDKVNSSDESPINRDKPITPSTGDYRSAIGNIFNTRRDKNKAREKLNTKHEIS